MRSLQSKTKSGKKGNEIKEEVFGKEVLGRDMQSLFGDQLMDILDSPPSEDVSNNSDAGNN